MGRENRGARAMGFRAGAEEEAAILGQMAAEGEEGFSAWARRRLASPERAPRGPMGIQDVCEKLCALNRAVAQILKAPGSGGHIIKACGEVVMASKMLGKDLGLAVARAAFAGAGPVSGSRICRAKCMHSVMRHLIYAYENAYKHIYGTYPYVAPNVAPRMHAYAYSRN
jgi:hypothetical protein